MHVAAVEVVGIGAPRVPAAPAPPAQRSRASRDPVGMPDMLIMLPWEFCTLSPGSRQRGRAGRSGKTGNPLRCVRARPRPPFVTIVAHSRALMTPRLRARRGRAAGGQVGRGAKRRSVFGAGVVFMIPTDPLMPSIGSVSPEDDLRPAPPCCLPGYLPYLPRPRRAAGASVRPEPRSRTCRAGVWYPPRSPRARAAPGSIPGGAPRRRRP